MKQIITVCYVIIVCGDALHPSQQFDIHLTMKVTFCYIFLYYCPFYVGDHVVVVSLCSCKFRVNGPVVCMMARMRGSRKFCQRGSNSATLTKIFFCIKRGEMIQIQQKAGHHRHASERHFNGVSFVGRWWPNIECWLGSFVIFQGIWTSIARKPCIFVIFQGVPDPLPPLDPPMTPLLSFSLFWPIL